MASTIHTLQPNRSRIWSGQNLGSRFENANARARCLCFPRFPCPRKTKDKERARRGIEEMGRSIALFSIQWTSICLATRGTYCGTVYVFLLRPARTVTASSHHVQAHCLVRTQGSGTRERARGGGRRGCAKEEQPNSRESKEISFFCNATRRGEKGRGGCRKIQGAESSELCRPSSWLASWSRFGSTPRDHGEILSRKRKGEWSWGAYRIGVEGGGWKGRQAGREGWNVNA